MFIHVPSQTFPLDYDGIKRRHPQYSFPEQIDLRFLSQVGYEPVETGPYPANLRADQYAELSEPLLVDGKWVRQYVVRTYQFSDTVDENGQPVTAEEAKNRFARGVKTQLRNDLARHRFLVETAGVTLPGEIRIKTDRQSQATIAGAYAASLLNPDIVIDWKGENGWIQIGAEQIASIARAVAEHVQSCFSRERQLSEKLDTLTPEQIFEFNVEREWNSL